MVVAKLIVKNVNDYAVISKLAEYSNDDTVTVDIYDRCHLTVPYMLFNQCISMLYSKNLVFEITEYFDTTED